MQISRRDKIISLAVSLGFFASQIQSLTRFPFMHSDESWLSGLTRFMMENRSLSVTEPFFDLYPRNPHAIKSTYHLLQSFFIQAFGYELFSVRLMSLFFGSLSLFFFYQLLRKFHLEEKWLILGTLALAVQPVYLTSTHFARQEIVVIFFLLLTAASWWNEKKGLALFSAFFTMGLHPNAFLGGAALVLTGLYLVWNNHEERKRLIRTLPWLIGFTGFYILVSLLMNPDFFHDYLAYGATLGVTASAGNKFTGFYLFFKKLWLGISGTYYLPPLRLSLLLMGTGLLMGGSVGLVKKDRILLGLQIHQLVWALGILLVGRYNATSIVYFVPGTILTWCLLATCCPRKWPVQAAAAGLLVSFSISSFGEINALPKNHYENYLTAIHQIVPEDAIVLANLNTEFAFEAGKLYDYRNLTHLDEADLSLARYIKDRKITYILYADELDYLHRNPDPWQVLYGPDHPWYDEMQSFLSTQCEEIANFEAPLYGNRIVPFLNDPYWHLHIYRITP